MFIDYFIDYIARESHLISLKVRSISVADPVFS